MPPLLDSPIQHLLARLTPDAPRALIALAGLPGSGKSTLAARLAAEVNAVVGSGTMAALGMDGFHLPKAALRGMPDPEAAFARRGAPWTFDVPALVARLHELKDAAGQAPVGWPGFRHEIGDPVEDAETVRPGTRLVLVEGLYLLHPDEGRVTLRPWPEGGGEARAMAEGVEGLDQSVSVVVCLKGSVIDVCLNDRHTLIERCFDHRGSHLGLFAQAGEVCVEDLRVSPLL